MLDTTQEERGQWTSASQAQYDLLCPGRHLAQRGLPDVKSPEAEAGDRIHAWLAKEAVNEHLAGESGLTDEEQETADACAAIRGDVIRNWCRAGEPRTVEVEARLWIDLANGIRHSGKPDMVILETETQRGLVLDYKTGRNEAPESSANQQLRDLAVLVAHNYGIKEVTVAIVQPWVTHQPELCCYDFKDLAHAMSDLEDRVYASNDPNMPRVPGEAQCRWCKAKAVCPEFAAASLPAGEISGPAATKAADPAQMAVAIRAMPGERLGLFLRMVRLAREVADEEVRARLKDGQAVPGWKFGKAKVTEKITDPQGLFERFVLLGGKTDQFLQAVSVGKTKLKEQVKAVTGEKGKALEGRLSELLAGLTESKESEPTLEAE